MVTFELWHVIAGALAGEYPTEAAALDAIYRAVRDEGPEVVADYALMRDDGEHDPVVIAEDAELADLAVRRHAPTPVH